MAGFSHDPIEVPAESRARDRLMHDGASLTVDEAILRHGQGAAVASAYAPSLPGAEESTEGFFSSL
jgi:hypothetical protein